MRVPFGFEGKETMRAAWKVEVASDSILKSKPPCETFAQVVLGREAVDTEDPELEPELDPELDPEEAEPLFDESEPEFEELDPELEELDPELTEDP